ncbi:MAG: LysR family transcriptional regulator [Oscillospiraceae bacterium]|nr:LysR family transcriptional regulator [Oscillospiraceae bacterium]
MDSKKIKALLAAAETGSLTAAAAELGYTQAGLTQMMNSLENELGVRMLVRGKSGVKLSDAGRSLLEPMRAFVAAADELERGVERQQEESRSSIRIGAYASVSRRWLPAILSEFLRENPGVDASVSVGSIAQMYESVRREELDCAFVSGHPALFKGLNWYPLHVDELLAVLPPDEPFDGAAFPIEGFSGREFLMPSLGFDMDIEPLFNAPAEPVSPHTRCTNMDDAALLSMVEHGLGLTILSRLILQDLHADVKALPLRPQGFRELGLIVSSKRQGEHILRGFVRSTRAMIAAMYGADAGV